jgi:hypothetical protein
LKIINNKKSVGMIKKTFKKAPLCMGMVLLFASLAVTAHASYIGFSGEIHTGNSLLSIHNLSDPGILISEITVTLGDNAVFSLNPGPPYVNDSITNPHWGDSDILGDDPADYTTAAAFQVGYLDLITDDISEGSSIATFSFNSATDGGFESGEAWGIWVDFDRNDGEGPPGGTDLDDTDIMVTFIGLGGETDILSFTYDIHGGTGKKSFPTDPIPFDGDSDLEPVPIPSTIWIFGAGLVGFIGIRRKLVS